MFKQHDKIEMLLHKNWVEESKEDLLKFCCSVHYNLSISTEYLYLKNLKQKPELLQSTECSLQKFWTFYLAK